MSLWLQKLPTHLNTPNRNVPDLVRVSPNASDVQRLGQCVPAFRESMFKIVQLHTREFLSTSPPWPTFGLIGEMRYHECHLDTVRWKCGSLHLKVQPTLYRENRVRFER